MDKNLNDTTRFATAPGVYSEDTPVPDYLMRHYRWAYVDPRAMQIFDRAWLINLIKFGNYRRLRQAVTTELDSAPLGKVLQVACTYGDLSPKLAKLAVAQSGSLDVVDVLPIQLKNLKWKLPSRTPARLLRMDSTSLSLPDARYDWVLLFFLLHEQPEAERTKTLSEALRVLKPDGKLIIVDYSRPYRWNPLRYLLPPLFALLEPFALSLMTRPLAALLPSTMKLKRETFCGGLYQKIVAVR